MKKNGIDMDVEEGLPDASCDESDFAQEGENMTTARLAVSYSKFRNEVVDYLKKMYEGKLTVEVEDGDRQVIISGKDKDKVCEAQDRLYGYVAALTNHFPTCEAYEENVKKWGNCK